jgi:3-hydroxyisobutyrate dehydrogenase-like beta-hydroxyacid dehydrogenase
MGLIGLGMMGALMAHCRARAGFALFVADVDAAWVAALPGAPGARPR